MVNLPRGNTDSIAVLTDLTLPYKTKTKIDFRYTLGPMHTGGGGCTTLVNARSKASQKKYPLSPLGLSPKKGNASLEFPIGGEQELKLSFTHFFHIHATGS